MPFFGNKFSPKKILQRKSNAETSKEALTDQRKINLKLGENQFIFENGVWIPVNGQNSESYLSKQKLEKTVQDLEEKNYLLRLKYEMILIMRLKMALTH
ncbi:protein chibby homolog 1-like isoform X2 [Diorhabda sublineata]|uniref:protein chibby homolog 1-like isoform X2 n=1 Tax=Diorhabda sublineata TaxID=1163346 RepID=UPI0024E0CDA4|nr:protein chibby homolog 1-like isoform X2 [Diorhabda sublineata]